MKTIVKTKYIIGSLIFGAITIFSYIHTEKYSVVIPVIFGTLFIFSIGLLISDKKEINKYAVIDENRKPIKTFAKENKATKFANKQNKDTKVVMLNIK